MKIYEYENKKYERLRVKTSDCNGCAFYHPEFLCEMINAKEPLACCTLKLYHIFKELKPEEGKP